MFIYDINIVTKTIIYKYLDVVDHNMCIIQMEFLHSRPTAELLHESLPLTPSAVQNSPPSPLSPLAPSPKSPTPKLPLTYDPETLPDKGIFICMFGRMNPPTLGHLRLVRKLIAKAKDNKVKNVYIFLSSNKPHTNDDPLYCNAVDDVANNKLAILGKLVDSLHSDIKVNIFCQNEREISPFVTLLKFIKSNEDQIKKIYLYYGDEKGRNDGNGLQRAIKNDSIQFISKPLGRGTNASSSDTSSTKISATLVRNEVAYRNFDKFSSLYRRRLNMGDKQSLFDYLSLYVKTPKLPNKKEDLGTKRGNNSRSNSRSKSRAKTYKHQRKDRADTSFDGGKFSRKTRRNRPVR